MRSVQQAVLADIPGCRTTYSVQSPAAPSGSLPGSARGFAAGVDGEAGPAPHEPPQQQGQELPQGGRKRGRPKGSTSARASSVKPGAADKFGALAAEWWDAKGPMAPLHAMNPLRARFTRDAICRCFQLDHRQAAPLTGLRVLDVGCGGGLLSESLARMGAHVTGIDVAAASVAIAERHAQDDPWIELRVTYREASAEQLVDEGAKFDVVTALEVIEHVDNQPAFCGSLAALTRDWGAVLVSTLSRTPQAYALAILGAEYVARLLPRGTHDWSQFITPKELVMMGDKAGLELEMLAGMAYDPLSGLWRMTENTGVNYIAYFQKSGMVTGNPGEPSAAGASAGGSPAAAEAGAPPADAGTGGSAGGGGDRGSGSGGDAVYAEPDVRAAAGPARERGRGTGYPAVPVEPLSPTGSSAGEAGDGADGGSEGDAIYAEPDVRATAGPAQGRKHGAGYPAVPIEPLSPTGPK